VEVELEAQPDQNVRRVLIRRDPRISERPKENRIKIAPQHFGRIMRQSRPVAQEPVSAPIKMGEHEFLTARRARRFERLHGRWRYFLADPVPGNYRYSFRIS